jgi:hypothetical protein
VDKRRYDHALSVCEQFDAANIRLIEILNDRGYVDTDPQPQSVVWERMDRPIARGLRGLLYVFSDLSQVDPSDLSVMFGGHGRLRIGFSEIEASPGHEPTDEHVRHAVRDCWDNPYCAFGGDVGTSLVCVQGDWSNVVDAKIKGGFAALAHGDGADRPYNPLYARAPHVPKPWGVMAMFAEFTGHHPPLQIDWNVERRPVAVARGLTASSVPDTVRPSRIEGVVRPSLIEMEPSTDAVSSDIVESSDMVEPTIAVPTETASQRACAFATFWEFARAVNRSEPAALALAADGANCRMTIDCAELRKLLSTFWVRTVFPRLSAEWRERMLEVLLQHVAIPNYALRQGRRTLRLSEATFEDLKQIVTETIFPDAVRSNLQLLIAVGTLWGEDALARFEFIQGSDDTLKPSRLDSLLHAFRSTASSESQSNHGH